MDKSERRVVDDIARHGWHCISVHEGENGPGFSYSIGFIVTLNHPEVIVFGLNMDLRQKMLWEAFRMVKEEQHSFREPGLHEGLLEGFPVASRPVHPTQHRLYFGFALWHRRHLGKPGTLEAVQLLWPGKVQGLFPFEDGCHPDVVDLQPLLCLPPRKHKPLANWPFDQPRTVAAITTRQVLEEGRPILSVVHYSDDHSWAFLCGTTNDTQDGRVIAMEEALQIDATLESIADLPPGYCAQRQSVGAPWTRRPNAEE
jgi:hypothetical protein